MLHEHRHYCATQPYGASKFMLSCDWSDPEQVDAALGILNIWAHPSALQAIEVWNANQLLNYLIDIQYVLMFDPIQLLDYKYPHPFIRQFAVKRLESLSTGDYMDYLFQAVKHEIHHDSALARFLLRKAWQDRKIG